MKKIPLNAVMVIFALINLSPLFAQDSEDPRDPPPRSSEVAYSTERIVSGASLGYLFSDNINLVGSFYFDFPFIFKNEKSAFVNLMITNALSKEDDDYSFEVQDFNYQIMLGARDYLTKKLIVSAFVGQQGVENIDREGSPFIRYVGFSIESREYRSFIAKKGLSWYGEVEAIFKNNAVNGEISFKGDVRFNYLVGEKRTYGLDFAIDSLINDFSASNDWKLGPRITFCNGCSNAASAFAYYTSNENPLGIGSNGIIVGFDYRERKNDTGSKITLPDIHGNFSVGGGDGREECRFALKFKSPSFTDSSSYRAAFDIDTFILTGGDTGNLYYFLVGGLERDWKIFVPGVYIYHRSNHELAEPNDMVTSFNVVELGIASKGWDRKGTSEGFPMGIDAHKGQAIMNFIARAGYVSSRTGGGERNWNARVGTRIDFPLAKSRYSPFLGAYWEGGNATRKEFSAGFRTPLDFDLAFEYKKDELYYGTDKEAFLLIASLAF